MQQITQVIEQWPFVSIFLLIAILLLCRIQLLRRWLVKRRIKRDFSQFEKSLLAEQDSEKAARFFNGETKLPTELTIHIPTAKLESEFFESLAVAVHQELQQQSLGYVIRHFSLGEMGGIDVWLDDFVVGVEVLRTLLIQHNVPSKTIIEYETGEFPVFE